jgi:predicted transcriptional regulator
VVSLWVGSAVLNKIQIMKSQAEKLKSEQCRRILEALESGPKTTDELVKLCKLTAGSIEKHTDVLVEAALVVRKAGNRIVSKNGT